MSMMGTVHLVGAGPGAPDLLTLRAARLLADADIVLYDALVHPEVVALATKAIHVPVGKRCGQHSSAQRFINKRLVDAARAHRVVVRLKGGDPMMFGRAQEEIAALRAAGVPYEIVPGVTAASAVSAEARASLTSRADASGPSSRSVVFVTPRVAVDATAEDHRWIAAVLAADTAVLYMASRESDRIAGLLIAAGRRADTPVVLVESASLPDASRRAMTLGTLAAQGLGDLDGPATLVVGEAMRHADIQAVLQERCRTA